MTEKLFKFCACADRQQRAYYPMPINAFHYMCLEMVSLQRRQEKEIANHLSETAEQRKEIWRKQRNRLNRLSETPKHNNGVDYKCQQMHYMCL